MPLRQGSNESMEISIREASGFHVLDVRGRLTIGASSEQLHEALTKLAESGGKKIVLNLNEVSQIDSSGISALVQIGRAHV